MKTIFYLLFSLSLIIACKPSTDTILKEEAQMEISGTDSLQVDNIFRTFSYLVPAEVQDSPALLFVLHGSGGDGARIKMVTNGEFDKIAKRDKDFVVVYPDGYDNHWNDCRAKASYKANTEDIDDNSFFLKMIDYFAERHGIDRSHVYMTGLSNGGHMCYKLAYELPESFAGFASYAANVPEASLNDCNPLDIAVPMMIINGTADPINPSEGGWVVVAQDSSRGKVLSTASTTAYWKSLLPCDPTESIISYEDTNPQDSTTAVRYSYTCAGSPIKVDLINIINGGHVPPLQGANPLPPELRTVLGRRNEDINSPELVMDFFRSLKK